MFKHLGEQALERAKQVASAAVAQLKAAGREPQSVEPKLLLPLVQAAALESDPTLAEKWAALLANAADPAQRVQVQPAFAEVLRQLTPTDARVANEMYFSVGSPIPGNGAGTTRFMPEHFGLTESELALSIDNLLRLRLFKAASPYGEGNPSQLSVMPEQIATTILGFRLMQAVTPPTP